MYIFDGPYLFEGTLEQRQLFLLVRTITADIYTAVKVTTLSKRSDVGARFRSWSSPRVNLTLVGC